jgi:hypothetical protein
MEEDILKRRALEQELGRTRRALGTAKCVNLFLIGNGLTSLVIGVIWILASVLLACSVPIETGSESMVPGTSAGILFSLGAVVTALGYLFFYAGASHDETVQARRRKVKELKSRLKGE